MKAVVADALNTYAVVDVDIAPPKAGEVLVRMAATGVCHSDLSMINGTIPTPFPTVLGHEGAGVVEEVGEGVTNVAPGDHVVLSFIPHCGECFHCVRDEPYLCNVAKQDGNLLGRDHPREPERRARLRDVLPRQHGRVRRRALDQRGPDGEGRAVPVRRPGRLRGHHRGRGRGQDRGGAPGLHGGGVGLRRGGALGGSRAHASRGRRASSRSI